MVEFVIMMLMKFILCNQFFVTLHFISDVSVILNYVFAEINSFVLNWIEFWPNVVYFSTQFPLRSTHFFHWCCRIPVVYRSSHSDPWIRPQLQIWPNHRSDTPSQPSFFQAGEEKIDGAKSGECGGWSTSSMSQSCTAAIATTDLCPGAWSRWNRTPFVTFPSHFKRSLPYVPKKITIGLSAWITFKVVSESKYNFKLWKYDYFSTFQWRPHLIWSSNHKEIWIFVKQVTGPFVPSFAIRMYVAFTDILPSQHTDLQTFQILCIPFQQRLILTT